MSTTTAASLINFLGFITGTVLYVMLLWMVLHSRRESNRLLVTACLLGFSWNVGAFAGYALTSLGFPQPAHLLMATAFSALSFLPAVVVHSALPLEDVKLRRWAQFIATVGYLMSGAATIMQFHSAIVLATTPSQIALRAVTVSYAVLLAILVLLTRAQKERRHVMWVVAMAVFAVSALHLSNHQGSEDPWWLALVGHHASLPLALVILYQDFRFALVDIFLKRALVFLLLVVFASAGFVFIVAPLTSSGITNEHSTVVLVAFAILTGLMYPALRRIAEWFVDEVILRRANYVELAAALSREIDHCQNPTAILDKAVSILKPALTAQRIEWETTSENSEAPLWVQQDRQSARVTVPTVEKPAYVVSIRDLSGGRRLLSDDVAMLERAALLLARRIDITRSFEERYQRNLEEQEVRKLAAEAELRALRAQINPHFLFNALTTVGYLIQTAPERAFATLMRLSGLLRGVLKSSDEFVSVGEELDLIEAYLDIERARFEDRLRVHIDVPGELRRIRIPALILQPLVENAIKHGISRSITGGEIRIAIRLEDSLLVSITDTGQGTTDAEVERGRRRGLGLSNVEQRLKRYGAQTSALRVETAPGRGTMVEVRIPVKHAAVAATI